MTTQHNNAHWRTGNVHFLPGGHLEGDDAASQRAAAAREVAEEIRNPMTNWRAMVTMIPMLISLGIVLSVGMTLALTGRMEIYHPWLIYGSFAVTLVYAAYGWIRSIGVD